MTTVLKYIHFWSWGKQQIHFWSWGKQQIYLQVQWSPALHQYMAQCELQAHVRCKRLTNIPLHYTVLEGSSLYHQSIAVAPQKFWSFCQKCKWQVTAKHTCTLCIWLCMKWPDMLPGCMVERECVQMAAVSSGTSHVRTKQCCIYATWVDSQSTL